MSFHNSGTGFSNANTGPGAQYNNNVAGAQYNYNYYGCRFLSQVITVRIRANIKQLLSMELIKNVSASNASNVRRMVSIPVPCNVS